MEDVELSRIEWVSLILLVLQKDGIIIFHADHYTLNDGKIRDSNLIPRMDL